MSSNGKKRKRDEAKQEDAKKKKKPKKPLAPEEEPVKHGDRRCGQEGCTNGAYYKAKGAYLCGVHVRKHEMEAVELRKRSKSELKQRQEAAQEAHKATVDQARLANAEHKRPGQLLLVRLRMMKTPEAGPGVLLIAPNNKHGGVTWARGMPALSPMRLGPVRHGQPGLADAQNVENFHQVRFSPARVS